MPITLDRLRYAASRTASNAVKSLNDARAQYAQTAFLSHSHDDQQLVKGAVTLLQESGWKVYVDWADTTMPPTPNKETAAKIKDKIVSLNYFLFLATPNSMTSRWCPWEIGYADGKKPHDKIIIIPTRDSSGRFYGNEYLQLYRRIEESSAGSLLVWEPGSHTSTKSVRDLR